MEESRLVAYMYGREVWFWADNDEAGVKCANEIARELKANGCKVKVIEAPEHFADKDDLWDAAERNDFTHDTLVDYINTYKEKKEKRLYNLLQEQMKS